MKFNYKVGEIINANDECKVCGNTEIRIVANKGRHYQDLTTAICTNCGLVHSHPIPSEDELKEYYREQYRSDYKSAFKPKNKHILRYTQNALERLNRLKNFTENNVKLLDIGSGSGEFLYVAKKQGFDVTGIEPHEGYSKYTRENFDVKIVNSIFQEAKIENESFDVITIHHVLEHLQRPLSALIHISKWLKFNGIIMIDVPDVEHSYHSPINRFHYAHIYNFNHLTLKAILTKAGFEVINHPNNQAGTILAARKVNEPKLEMKISMPENYENLWQIFSQGEKAEIYKKKKPLFRIFSKLNRYSKEFVRSLFFNNSKNIVDAELKRLGGAVS